MRLAPPAAVTRATDEYLDAQDAIKDFIAERCVEHKEAREQSSALFASWKEFTKEREEKPGHQRAFNDRLEQRGFKRERNEKGKTFKGLRLKKAESEEKKLAAEEKMKAAQRAVGR